MLIPNYANQCLGDRDASSSSVKLLSHCDIPAEFE